MGFPTATGWVRQPRPHRMRTICRAMSQSTSPVRGSNEVFVDDLGMFLGFVLSRPGP